MSSDLHRLIGSAFSDQALREKLLANPKAVLAGLNISNEERNMLMAGLGKANSNVSMAGLNQALGGKLLGW